MTDGSITPEEAFAKSIEILVDQFSVLTTLDSGKAEEVEEEAKIEEKPEAVKEAKAVKADDPMEIAVSTLKSLSTRTLNVLEKNGIETISDIVKLTETEIEGLDGMGAKGIKEIKKATGDFGINLRKE